MKKFVSYRRVSTRKQGASGLGLEAQQEIISYFVEREGGSIVADYAEVHSGKDLTECVELRKAMQQTKKLGAVLVVAKSDRFRNVSQALEVLDEMGEGNIMFCDLPHTDRFTLTLFFALAERERLITSIRTKQALRQKKERGEKLGSPLFVGRAGESLQERSERVRRADEVRRLAVVRSSNSRRFSADHDVNNRRAFAAISGRAGSLQELAMYLNESGFKTSTGGEWGKVAVMRLKARYMKGGASC